MEASKLMTLQELKEAILTNNLPDAFLIFKCTEGFFIADQYIDRICHDKNLERCYIDSIYDSQGTTGELFNKQQLFIVKTKKFSERVTDYSLFDNVIVLCDTIDEKLVKSLEDYTVVVPKVEPWQVMSYIQHKCQDMTEGYANWLIDACDKNLYKLDSELDKLSLFSGQDRQDLLETMRYAPTSDLYSITIWKLRDYVLNKDKEGLRAFFQHANYCDIDPVSLFSNLLTSCKISLYVKFAKVKDDLGLPAFQVTQALSYNLAESFLKDTINFLSKLDLELKSGRLDLPKPLLIDYIICKLLSM